MTIPVRAAFPTSFGVFSPTGHVVMAFANDKSAEMAQGALLAAGFSENDVGRYNKDEVTLESEKSGERSSNPAQIGQDVAKIEEYLAPAKEGCGFLIVHAPQEARSDLALAVAHAYGLMFAEKYNRLTLEELA